MAPLWWFWAITAIILFLLPLGYGWRYRGWGPPYPTYWRRRRAAAAAEGPTSETSTLGWGFGADLLWIVFVVLLAWLVFAFFTS